MKLKFYLASLFATRTIDNILDMPQIGAFDIDENSVFYQHQHKPSFVMAETIEAAADQLKAAAFEGWKKEDGWTTHNAIIIPVTKEFVDVLEKALPAKESFDLSSDEEELRITWE